VRKIIHRDMDAFYASVEQHDDPFANHRVDRCREGIQTPQEKRIPPISAARKLLFTRPFGG
jgi:hypothetical protein